MEERGGGSAPLCDGQIDQLDRKGRKPLEAMGLMEQGGGAGATGKGDHQQTGGRRAWSGAGGMAPIEASWMSTRAQDWPG